MGIFWINLSIVYILSFFARYFSKPITTASIFIKPNKLLVFFVLTVLVLVSGLRKNIGDTYFYMYSYTLKDFNWGDIDFNGDFGFDILQMFLQDLSRDPQLLVFSTALITNALIIIVLYKYARVFELSLYVYITSGMYLTSMNGIRQFLASAIIFTATKYLLDGNWKKYMLVVLLAATIHKSALILIPIYFIVRRKSWSKETYILLFVAVFIVIGFSQFSGALFSALEDTQYGHYQNFSEGGANILRVVVNAVPLVFAYLGREKFTKIFPHNDYFVNMSILNLVFMIISTQNWIFARFSIYFGLYNLILISWVVKLFSDKDQRFIYYGILVCYFIYYFYDSVVALNILYESDFIKF